ncbi:MAG: hypothetical protein ACUVQM_01010 [Candidatus Hadarchaeaceae archaeon]
MAAVSIVFIAETSDIMAITVSEVLTALAVLIIAVYVIKRLKAGHL